MNKQSIAAAAAIAAAFVGLPATASAATFECKCLDTFAPTVAAGKLNLDGNTFRCSGTFSGEGNGTETGDYNQYFKVWFAEGRSTDNLTTVGVRPRKSTECMISVFDAYNNHSEWDGGGISYCNTSEKKNVSGMDLVLKTDGLKLVSGKINSTTKVNKFAAFYAAKQDANYLQAACIEDR